MTAASPRPGVVTGALKRELRVLGPTEVRVEGVTHALRPRERDVLTALALHHSRPTPLTEIVELLWPTDAPRTGREAVQNHIARIRRALGDGAIVTEPSGYRLGPGWTIDAVELDSVVDRVGRAMGGGDHRVVLIQLRRALTLMRGEPFADLAESADVSAERARRHEQRLAAEEQLTSAQLADGQLTTAISGAGSQVLSEPFREVRWAVLALSLYRDGQRRESLAALERGRLLLRDEAGLDPGPVMRSIERRILHDEPALSTASVWALLDSTMSSTELVPRPIFVGRRNSLNELRRMLADVVDARVGRIVSIVGDPGIGKSALAEEAAAQASLDGFDVVSAVCQPVPAELLEPWGEVVRGVLMQESNPRDIHGAEALHDVRFAGALGESPERLHGNASAAVAEILVAHALHRPTLIVIDDAQYLTESAAHILEIVAAGLAPIVVVRIQSTEDFSENGFRSAATINVSGLELAEFTQLLATLTTQEIAAGTAGLLHVSTDGNPRLLRRMIEAGVDPTERRSGTRRMLRSAFDQLGPVVEQIANVLAISGAPIPFPVLAATLDNHSPAEVQRGVERGCQAGLFRSVGGSRIDIRDGDVRTSVRSSMADVARAGLHERLARTLADAGLELMAAAHILAAPDRFGANEIDLLGAVAVGAGRAAMHAEAAHYLAGAVSIAERVVGANHLRTLGLALQRVEHLRRAGDQSWIDLAWAVVHTAEAADAHDMCAFGAAALCQVGPLIRSGSLDPAVADTVERALARPLSPLARSACAGQATLLYSASGNVARCRELFDVALASAHESGDDRAVMETYSHIVVALTHPNDWRLGADLAAEMLSLAEQLDDDDGRFSSLHLYFSAQVQYGDPLLRTTFMRQAGLARTLRSEGRSWMAEYQHAVVAFLDGRLDDAEAISAANAARSPMHESRTTSTHFMLLYVVRVAQGRGQELAPALDAIVADQTGLPGWRSVATWLAALRGDTARVLADCDALACGAAFPDDMTWSGATMLLGRAVATTGDETRCRALIEVLAPWSGHMTWYGSGTVGPFDLALAELAVAIGDSDAALRYEAATKRIVNRLRAVVFQPDLDRLAARLHG